MRRRRDRPVWAVTLVLSMSGLVASLNGTLVIPLIPIFPAALGVSSDDASWLITITLVVGAVTIPAASRLADMFGRQRLLIICLAVMAIGSLLSAVGGSFPVVLVGRALAGMGVPLIPIGISVLRDSLPAGRIGSAIALMSATLGIGSALGLPAAGLLYEQWGWTSVFWMSGGVSAALALLVSLVVSTPSDRLQESFDVAGAILLAIATACVVLYIAKAGAWGWTASLWLLVVSTLAFTAWVFWELRARCPLVDLRASGSRPVILTNAAAALIGFALLINLLLAMQQLQAPASTGYGFGLTVVHAALVMLPGSVVQVVIAPLNGALLNRHGGRIMLMIGGVIMSIGYVARMLMSSSVIDIMISTTIVGLGGSLAFAAMPTIIMKSIPRSMTAAGNGLNALIRQIGTSASSSSVGAALTVATVVVAGIAYPTWEAITVLNLLAALAAVMAAAFAMCIPRGI